MKKLLVIAGALFLAFAVVPANADHDANTIHACANEDHAVRIVDESSDCTTSETVVEWDIEGPVGPSDGYDTGVSGVVSITSGSGWINVQSEVLPAGSYILNSIVSRSSGTASGCRLHDGTSEIDFRFFGPENTTPMGSVTLASGGTITLDCIRSISTYSVISGRITAIKVGTLH